MGRVRRPPSIACRNVMRRPQASRGHRIAHDDAAVLHVDRHRGEQAAQRTANLLGGGRRIRGDSLQQVGDVARSDLEGRSAVERGAMDAERVLQTVPARRAR